MGVRGLHMSLTLDNLLALIFILGELQLGSLGRHVEEAGF